MFNNEKPAQNVSSIKAGSLYQQLMGQLTMMKANVEQMDQHLAASSEAPRPPAIWSPPTRARECRMSSSGCATTSPPLGGTYEAPNYAWQPKSWSTKSKMQLSWYCCLRVYTRGLSPNNGDRECAAWARHPLPAQPLGCEITFCFLWWMHLCGATDMQSEKKPDTRQQAWWTLTDFRFKVYGLGFLGIGFELQEL